MPIKKTAAVFFGLLAIVGTASAAPVYLNISNITVEVGPGTSPGSFNNTFNSGQTINKVIDAPSAAAEEFHNQTTHIWYTAEQVGGGLELLFDFGLEYDITTLHFWNYTGESFDVDTVDFTFYNALDQLQGTLAVNPALGSSPGIQAEDIPLAAPLNVRYVTAFLTGDNRQVDFQNIGFTADVSDDQTQPPTPGVPSPGTLALLGLGLIGYRFANRRERG